MAEPISRPEMRREGDDYIFCWEQEAAEVTVRDIGVGRDGPRAEVWARHLIAGHLHAAMLNLLSTSSKTGFVKAVLARDPGNNWADMVEQFSVLATEAYRQGEPLELLEPRRRPEAGQWAVNPLAQLGQITLFFGDGKTLKSYTAQACCRAMALEVELAGMRTTRLRPAFLDWEWDKAEHEDRLLRLGGDVTVYYQACTVPLQEQAKALKRKLDREGIDFIGVDSLGLACGGDPSKPELALPFFAALRYLGRTAIVVHHVPKGSKDPYGSVYIRNSARAGWYFVRVASPDEDSAKVALQHRWSNVGRLQKPIGLRFTFDDEVYTTEVSRTDPGPVLALTGDLPARELIVEMLKLGKAQTGDIVDATGLKAEVVRARLAELRRDNVAGKIEDEWYLLDTVH